MLSVTRFTLTSACVRTLITVPLALLAGVTGAAATDISDPTRFLFVADAAGQMIDVLELDAMKSVARIDTELRPDHVLVTPFAPVLLYADIAARKIVHVNLEDPAVQEQIAVPLAPHHVVMNAGGTRIAITDAESGGLLVMNAYSGAVELAVPDFPATEDVLFDPNDVDIFYSNSKAGSVGRINIVSGRRQETSLADGTAAMLSKHVCM